MRSEQDPPFLFSQDFFFGCLKYLPMSALFIASIVTLLVTNIPQTRKILPLKNDWLYIINVVATIILLIFGIRSGAVFGGGMMMSQ